PPPRRPRREAHQAHRRAVRLPRHPQGRPLQGRPLPVLAVSIPKRSFGIELRSCGGFAAALKGLSLRTGGAGSFAGEGGPGTDPPPAPPNRSAALMVLVGHDLAHRLVL